MYRKVEIECSETLKYKPELISGEEVVAHGSKYAIVQTNRRIGFEIEDLEKEILLARIDNFSTHENLVHDLMKLAAYHRWKLEETSAIFFEGHALETNRQSQLKLMTILNQFQTGMIDSINWKFDNGKFQNLDKQKFLQMTQVVMSKVSELFDLEMKVCNFIRSTNDTEQLKTLDVEGLFKEMMES